MQPCRSAYAVAIIERFFGSEEAISKAPDPSGWLFSSTLGFQRFLTLIFGLSALLPFNTRAFRIPSLHSAYAY